MTSTSQSEMSTPFNVMLTPTASLLVGGSARCSAGGGCTAASTVSTGGSAGEGLREADAPGCAAAREVALAVVPRPALTGGSYSAGFSADLSVLLPSTMRSLLRPKFSMTIPLLSND